MPPLSALLLLLQHPHFSFILWGMYFAIPYSAMLLVILGPWDVFSSIITTQIAGRTRTAYQFYGEYTLSCCTDTLMDVKVTFRFNHQIAVLLKVCYSPTSRLSHILVWASVHLVWYMPTSPEPGVGNSLKSKMPYTAKPNALSAISAVCYGL